jgi:hypothetical protein
VTSTPPHNSQGSRVQVTGMPSYGMIPQSPFSSPLCLYNRKSNARASRLSRLRPLFSIFRSLVVLWSQPWSAINRPSLTAGFLCTGITVLAVQYARTYSILGLSCCYLRCTVRYTSGLLGGGFSRWIRRRRKVYISSFPTSPACE